MADAIDVKLSGLSEVQDGLRRWGSSVDAELLHEALAAGADVLAKEVAARTPIRTGLLRDSIETDIEIESTHGTAAIGFGKQGYRARLVEFGHRETTRSGAEGHVPAHPFLRPAFDDAAERTIQAFAATLQSGMASVEEKS